MRPMVLIVDDLHVLSVLENRGFAQLSIVVAHKPEIELDCSITCSFDWLGIDWHVIKEGFRTFLNRIAPRNWEPNPLPILARAVNRLKLGRVIFQPCWSANRWKSKT